MDALMLEGWTPILLAGIIAVIVMVLVSRKTSNKNLLRVSIGLSIISLAIIVYSVIGIGGWKGMGIGAVTKTILFGIWLGTGIGARMSIKHS